MRDMVGTFQSVREERFAEGSTVQTLNDIRRMLRQARLVPRKRLGQNFLIDKNLMSKLLGMAELKGDQTVLEVGPGTGSLTEELLTRSKRVVAVEIDAGLCELLRRRLGPCDKLVLLRVDVLAGKGAIAPRVLHALGAKASLVANLPYNIAAPLIARCLIDSWRASRRVEQTACLFESLTFTIQRELAERLAARPGSGDYGPLSVLVALLGRIKVGATVPATAFWPRPKVQSRIVRIDFASDCAGRIADAETLEAALALSFGQRRKQIGSVTKRKLPAFAGQTFAAALRVAGIDRTSRAEDVAPEQFLALANSLASS